VRTIRRNLMVGLLTLLLCASAAAQGAERNSGGYSPTLGPWRQLAKLTESKGRGEDYVGWSVAVSGDGSTVAVGAAGWCRYHSYEGCGQGAVLVFVKPATGWTDMTETALLLASDGRPGEYLGESVAISDDGSTIVAGAPLWPADHTFRGAAYVFVRPTSGWANMTETARLTSTDGSNVSLANRSRLAVARLWWVDPA
jgi:FG-GAP repeat